MPVNATQPQSVTTAILAGGAATRLGGCDKGLASLRGRPLVSWVLEALALEPDQPRLIVANRNIQQYARFAPTISDHDCERFGGPLAGVAAALGICTTEWLYTVPVDCVRPRREIFDALRDESRRRACDVVVAHDGIRRQPLFALYRSNLAGSAARAVVDASMGVRQWQDTLQTIEVDLSGLQDPWLNLNTPEDVMLMAERMATND